MQEENMVRLKQTMSLNAGMIFKEGPSQVNLEEPHYEVVLPIGKDHVMTVLVSESAVEENPSIFQKY